MFLEYGMVLRTSGRYDAYKLAAEQLEIAYKENQHDSICTHALGDCYFKLGNSQRALELLLPLLDSPSPKSRQLTYPLVLSIYDRTGEIFKAAELRSKIAADIQAR